jgi:hypothetical protein
MATASIKSDAAGDSGFVSEDQRRASALVRATRERQRQALELQRENILSQRTSNPNRRSALESALAQIESQLKLIN